MSAESFSSGGPEHHDWPSVIEGLKWLDPDLARLAERLSVTPPFSKLYPYTSLYHLCFSDTPCYPFSGNYPNVASSNPGVFRPGREEMAGGTPARSTGVFQIRTREGELIAEGGPEEAIAILTRQMS